MTGLACNAWRDPWHVRVVRSIRRDPRAFAMNAVAWGVRGWIVVGWVVLVPLAVYRMGAA